MLTALKYVVLVLFALLLLLLVGQLGWLKGKMPAELGVRDGRLKPPASTPNSVSSQASLYPKHPQRNYADIAPLRYSGDGRTALQALAAALAATTGCVLVRQEPTYLYAQCTTRWLKFTDDAEFYLDEAAGVIQVRSASRLGRKDMGVNRARIEALRHELRPGGPVVLHRGAEL